MARRHIVSVEIWLFSFLAMALDGGEWPSSYLGLIRHGKRALGAH